MRKHGVRCLLIGGQACVFYGAAEFSRDIESRRYQKNAKSERLADDSKAC